MDTNDQETQQGIGTSAIRRGNNFKSDLSGNNFPPKQWGRFERNQSQPTIVIHNYGDAQPVDLIAWWRLAVSSGDYAIYNSSDHIVRQTIYTLLLKTKLFQGFRPTRFLCLKHNLLAFWTHILSKVLHGFISRNQNVVKLRFTVE